MTVIETHVPRTDPAAPGDRHPRDRRLADHRRRAHDRQHRGRRPYDGDDAATAVPLGLTVFVLPSLLLSVGEGIGRRGLLVSPGPAATCR
jgi:hypothetical protein